MMEPDDDNDEYVQVHHDEGIQYWRLMAEPKRAHTKKGNRQLRHVALSQTHKKEDIIAFLVGPKPGHG